MSIAALFAPPEPIEVAHFFGGGVYLKETFIAAGSRLAQHKHEHEHLSYLVAGRVTLEVDGERQVLQGPACLTIEAGKHHGIRAETDTIWLCIHRSDCTDAAQIDETLIVDEGEAGAQCMTAIVEGLKE